MMLYVHPRRVFRSLEKAVGFDGLRFQAGAVVHGEIPLYAIAGGNPAKVFKYRDFEHFQKLKAEGKVSSDIVYCDLVYGER